MHIWGRNARRFSRLWAIRKYKRGYKHFCDEKYIDNDIKCAPYYVAGVFQYSDNMSWFHSCMVTLQWCQNGLDGVSNHQPHHCLLSHLFGRRSKKTSMFRVTGLCAGNSPVTGDCRAQMASNAENVSIWCRHHKKYDKWKCYNDIQDCKESLCLIKISSLGKSNLIETLPKINMKMFWSTIFAEHYENHHDKFWAYCLTIYCGRHKISQRRK